MKIYTHLSVEIECNSLVGNLHIGNLDDDLLELIMVPVGESLSHGQSSVVGFIWSSAFISVWRREKLTIADI